jgi:hypothetical protein
MSSKTTASSPQRESIRRFVKILKLLDRWDREESANAEHPQVPPPIQLKEVENRPLAVCSDGRS